MDFFPLSRSKKWRDFLIYLLDALGLTGIEPATSALTGRWSDQLNYHHREIQDLAENLNLFYLRIVYFQNTKEVISFHGGLANYWAELDLNQINTCYEFKLIKNQFKKLSKQTLIYYDQVTNYSESMYYLTIISNSFIWYNYLIFKIHQSN